MTNYIKVSGNSQVNYLRVDLDYSKGGYNYFTYKNEPRGYYIHVSPVYRENRDGFVMESYTAFSGIKNCLLEVARKSNKAEAEAFNLFEQNKERYIDYILEKHGLVLDA